MKISRLIFFLVLFSALFFVFFAEVALAKEFLGGDEKCEIHNLNSHFVEGRRWFDSLPSEDSEPKILILAGKGKAFPFMQVPGRHSIWDVTLGVDVPIVTFDHNDSNELLQVGKGCWGFGMWFDLHFKTVLDFNEAMQPIANTDYIFGPAGKLTYGVSEKSRLSFLLRYRHNSSHAGDQYLVVALRNYGESFRLIDVNYEFFDYGVSFDHIYSWGLVTHRLSVSSVASMSHKGFYSTGVFGHTPIKPSEVNTEPSVSFEWKPYKKGWGPYASYTGTLATTFNYDKEAPEEREKRRYTQNIVIGLRNFSITQGFSPEPVMMISNGRNPNGMFSDQNTYRAVAFGVLIRLQ